MHCFQASHAFSNRQGMPWVVTRQSAESIEEYGNFWSAVHFRHGLLLREAFFSTYCFKVVEQRKERI